MGILLNVHSLRSDVVMLGKWSPLWLAVLVTLNLGSYPKV